MMLGATNIKLKKSVNECLKNMEGKEEFDIIEKKYRTESHITAQ